jgi:energy-converting hydrogenase Eha subunit A
MPIRYRAVLALTLALCLPAPGLSADRPAHRRRHEASTAFPASVSATDLYARRALRRARILIELKLLELRSERLERVRKAIEKHIPIDQLLDTP